jgi:aspartate aminotransferase
MPSTRVQQIGASPTLRISAKAARMRADGVDVLDFSAGQPDFPTPETVKDAGKRAIDENRTRYTANEGLLELRQAIADKLKRDNDLEYEPSQIVVSPGAKASLYFAMQALVDPGDEVLIPSPYWVSYPPQVSLAGGRPVIVPTREEEGFRVDPAVLERALTARSRVLVLNYPANPTGASYTAEELAGLARLCVERDLWVLADEIYEKLLYDGLRFQSIAALDDAVHARTVVVNGMSKTYSMTGWRIGYAAAPQEIASAMARVQSHSTSNATSIAQWASLQALLDGPEELERRRLAFQERRDAIHEGLDALDGVRCSRPRGAFYIFPDVSGLFGRSDGERTLRSGEDVAAFLLDRARVAVVPGEAFGAPSHVRFSYAVSMERLREGLGRVAEALAALS